MSHLVSFADSRLHRSLDRLKSQAKLFSVFDEIYLYDENDLPSDFRKTHQYHLIKGSKGYGYWCWKPQIIKMALDKINEGDCLLYVDAGCHLNIKGEKRLNDYFEMVESSENGILAFQANKPTPENSTLKYDGRKLFSQPNYQWIKGDVFEYFGVKNNEFFTRAQAIGAGIIFIKKSKSSEAVITEWLDIANNHYNLLDDSPSKSRNLDGFIEHRHDQAIWSLLCLKHNVRTLCAYEYYYPMSNRSGLSPDWDSLKCYPIHARRDRDFGLIGNIYHQIIRISRKIKFYFGRQE